jgi:hypothetical protein
VRRNIHYLEKEELSQKEKTLNFSWEASREK